MKVCNTLQIGQSLQIIMDWIVYGFVTLCVELIYCINRLPASLSISFFLCLPLSLYIQTQFDIYAGTGIHTSTELDCILIDATQQQQQKHQNHVKPFRQHAFCMHAM